MGNNRLDWFVGMTLGYNVLLSTVNGHTREREATLMNLFYP